MYCYIYLTHHRLNIHSTRGSNILILQCGIVYGSLIVCCNVSTNVAVIKQMIIN